MKLNYFGYCLKNEDTMQKMPIDLLLLLKNYCNLDDVFLKNQFLHQDEHLYLMYENNDVFLFLITRSGELIRTINTNNLSIAEVNNLLQNDQTLGFASYILIKENCFGFASTLMAPKANIFIKYVNDLLIHFGVVDWSFSAEAILHQATRADALVMPFIGKATISVEKHNTIAQDFMGQLGVTQEEAIDIEGFEITIKPKAKRNIKEAVTKLLNATPDDGVVRMTIKAKEEIDSLISDFYLVGKGHISDSVDKSDETRLTGLLNDKYVNNRHLNEKLAEYVNRANVQEINPNDLVRLSNHPAWAGIVSGIQDAN